MSGASDKPFDRAVSVRRGQRTLAVGSAREAFDLLADVEWPLRDAAHEEALATTLKVLDGHRSTADARERLVEAARSAGILVEG